MLSVGDKVIYRKSYQDPPIQTRVVKTTKSGQVCVDPVVSTERFRANGMGTIYEAVGRGQKGMVWFFTPEKWETFVAQHATIQADKEAKRQKEKQRQEQLHAERQQELDEVYTLLNADLEFCTLHKTVLPDGSRLRTMQIPVKADLTERKGEFEILIIRLKDVEQTNWEKNVIEKQVELYLTSCNKRSYSWPSYSSTYHKNDEEALWEAIRKIYHNW